jgi:pilus assembly protein Flp/PilA
MRKVVRAIRRFVQHEDGPAAVEYAVMLAFIILVCFLAIRGLGSATSKTFSVADSMLQ